MTAAVGAVQRFEDVLEVAAEETLRALGAASVSLSRWAHSEGRVRTLINVGQLGPHEQRLPIDELYVLSDYPRLKALLERGEPAFGVLADRALPQEERDLLLWLRKAAFVSVPIAFGGRTWGELEVFFTSPEELPAPDDLHFLQAIATQIAVALGRAETYSRVAAQALRDPLTGIENRRSVNDQVERLVREARAGDSDLAVVFADLDGLKAINDWEGHTAGDAALRRAAAVLQRTAEERPGARAGRLGGDEFCLLLPGCGLDEARALAEDVERDLAAGDPALGISYGVASMGSGARDAAELFRAADVAQYEAKRSRGGRTIARRQRLADPARLAAVRASGLLESSSKALIDAVTARARRLLGVPLASVTLVTEDRLVWPESRDLPEPWAGGGSMPHAGGLSHHVVVLGRPLTVGDARQHPLARDSLAVRELGVASYAGVPLSTGDGRIVGALCVVDHEPRAWSAAQLEVLTRLSTVLAAEIDLRRAAAPLDAA